jgi:preprotein translocase subunit SecF
MFHIVNPNSKIDFVGKRKIWIGFSIVMIIATIVLFFTKGLNYGIDFTGGAEVKVQVPATWDTSKLRATLEKGQLSGLKILQIGDVSESSFLIRAQDDGKNLNLVVKQITDSLAADIKEGEFVIKSADIVGPSAGSQLRKNGFLAMFYVLLSILLYVALRFDFRFAPGAVLALFHDAIIVLGVFIVTQKEFDLTVLAAILALIGYSNNDTIIVYDRVRETMKMNPSASVVSIVNQSINQTLGRTIMTTLSTFASVAMLWVFGGHVLEPFAFALMIGLLVGAYSSVFIASSMVIVLAHYQENQRKSGKNKKRREVKLSPEAHIGL